MGTRPWITPQEVKEYSDFPEVQNREDKKLAIDIMRAENYVIKYTNNRFAEKDPQDNDIPIPDDVRVAVILIAEAYSYNAVLLLKQGTKKSETFDDYSYTVADTADINISSLELETLLNDHIIQKTSDTVAVKLRAL